MSAGSGAAAPAGPLGLAVGADLLERAERNCFSMPCHALPPPACAPLGAPPAPGGATVLLASL
jgi:hypothetical protein